MKIVLMAAYLGLTTLACLAYGQAKSQGSGTNPLALEASLESLKGRVVSLDAKDGEVLLSRKAGQRRRAITISAEALAELFKTSHPKLAKKALEALADRYAELAKSDPLTYTPERLEQFVDETFLSHVVRHARFQGALARTVDVNGQRKPGLRMVGDPQESTVIRPEEIEDEPDSDRLIVVLPHAAVGVYRQVFLGVYFTRLPAVTAPELPNSGPVVQDIFSRTPQARVQSPLDYYWEGIVQMAPKAKVEAKAIQSGYNPFSDAGFGYAEKVDDNLLEVDGVKTPRFWDSDSDRSTPLHASFKFTTRGDDLIISGRPAILTTGDQGVRISSEKFDTESRLALEYRTYVRPTGIYRNGSPTIGASAYSDQDGLYKKVLFNLGYEYDLIRNQVSTEREFRKFDELTTRARARVSLDFGYQLSEFRRDLKLSDRKPMVNLSGLIVIPPFHLGRPFVREGKPAQFSLQFEGTAFLSDRSTYDERRLRDGLDPLSKRSLLDGGITGKLDIPIAKGTGLQVIYRTNQRGQASGTEALRRFEFLITGK